MTGRKLTGIKGNQGEFNGNSLYFFVGIRKHKVRDAEHVYTFGKTLKTI